MTETIGYVQPEKENEGVTEEEMVKHLEEAAEREPLGSGGTVDDLPDTQELIDEQS